MTLKPARPAFVILTLCAVLWISGAVFGGCSFHPDWVHTLPDAAKGSTLDDVAMLPGIYDRPVFSRFGIANKRARSGGR
ncbi:MAG: hypothetical protein HY042_11580, partial [Spirochaetia bacterium]|nr:hypothetical protein [Spirochaetia bacterium]